MRLRNKKTGEVGEIGYIGSSSGELTVSPINRVACESIASYNSLAELNEEWEDYEEPKEYWFINSLGEAIRPSDTTDWVAEDDGYHKAIGNYFETKEEAEKAVEKLKAWKRLKDFGCGFILDDHFTVKFVGPDARKIKSAEEQKSLSDAYKLLFGGEE